MDQPAEMPGHRVVAEISLLRSSQGGLQSTIKNGNRSLIFVTEPPGEAIELGFVFEDIDGDGEPGSSFTARLWFWNDSASVHASRGTRFKLRYGRVVGEGQVTQVLPVW